jgi:hypothetical protein
VKPEVVIPQHLSALKELNMLAKVSNSYLSLSPIILRPFRAWDQDGGLYLRLHRRLFIFSHIHDCSVKPLSGLWIRTKLPAGRSSFSPGIGKV